MKYYELRHEELDEALSLRNSIFSNVDTEHWTAMNCTGVVARAEHDVDDTDWNSIVGFIPLQFRSQVMRPGVVAPVVYENAVGVAEHYRSRGFGSAMIDEASRFIQDRADALFVIRGGESSTGYRFYRKSGHSDLCFAVSYLIASDAQPHLSSVGVVEVDRETWLSREVELHRLYGSTYGEFGGHTERATGFWRSILDGHVFKSRNWRLYLDGGNALAGYAVVVAGSWQDLDTPHIYELIGSDEHAIERLLSRISADANGSDIRIRSVSLEDPIREVLERRGWGTITDRSEPQIMARIVAPGRLFDRLIKSTDGGDRFAATTSLRCSTPHRSISLNNPESPEEYVDLEMKEHALTRLLCCRAGLKRALDVEMIRCRSASDRSLDMLDSIFRPAPWAQWFTDYV